MKAWKKIAAGLSFSRFLAIVSKEFIQMRRDRVTFGIMIGIPLLQLTLFGFAINSDPKHLPAAVLLADGGPHARSLLNAIEHSEYLNFVRELQSETEADEVIRRGEVQIVINIPESFSRELLRGEHPSILAEVDATDPAATNNAVAAVKNTVRTAFQNDAVGALDFLAVTAEPIDIKVHARYNPESITQYNIVPGLMGVVLTMTMVMITALAITREQERGTMENLLSMPTRPLEVMIGKIIPYILVGYVQLTLILIAAKFLFHVPMVGSLFLLYICTLAFIAANLSMGITFSTLAKNQLQAVQMSFFFFLPSLLLSGFMFPFRGMPNWAQYLGEVLPLTHFLRIVRGLLLKGNGFIDVVPQLLPIGIFTLIVLGIGVIRFKQTLD